MQKTNAIRIIEQAKLTYSVQTYPHGKEAVDGKTVASLLGQNERQVFKTLVTIANTKEYLVFVIPVCSELDKKQAAKVAQVKSIDMIPVKDLLKVTGYVRGGCSFIGMRKTYRTFIDEQCLHFDTIMFSAGKIGMQLSMAINDIQQLMPITIASISTCNS